MTVLSLKTELDVAELLLAEGWCPRDINGILVFPLPRAAFHQLGNHYCQTIDSDVIKATAVTPTTLYRARQLLASAGWVNRELNSLLKPYLYSLDPWANQTMHTKVADSQGTPTGLPPHWGANAIPLPTLSRYRRAMALKRMVSLALVVSLVFIAVVMLG